MKTTFISFERFRLKICLIVILVWTLIALPADIVGIIEKKLQVTSVFSDWLEITVTTLLFVNIVYTVAECIFLLTKWVWGKTKSERSYPLFNNRFTQNRKGG